MGDAQTKPEITVTERALRERAERIDHDVVGFFQSATERVSIRNELESGVALIAVGGYGRGLLFPHSDLDLWLLHRDTKLGNGVAEETIEVLAAALWQPIWDAGHRLGHGVYTPDEVLDLAESNIETATSILSARHLAGDEHLTDQVRSAGLKRWQAAGEDAVDRLWTHLSQQYTVTDRVGWSTEPDIKNGQGGIRDLDALGWIELARPDQQPLTAGLEDATDTLRRARHMIHDHSGRDDNRLTHANAAAMANEMGLDPGSVCTSIAKAGRKISRALEAAVCATPDWADVGLDGLRVEPLGTGQLNADLPDPDLANADQPNSSVPWSDQQREAFLGVLARSDRSPTGLDELTDSLGLTNLIAGWAAIEGLCPGSVHHLYVVDRHSVECVKEASRLAHDLERGDLLLVAALLHDIGKGASAAPSSEEHLHTGADLAGRVATSMGFCAEDVDVITLLVEHHLLLPRLATRRDLTDESVISLVAETTGNETVLDLLAALTEADSKATSPAMWSRHRAALIEQLVTFTKAALDSPDPDDDGPQNREESAAPDDPWFVTKVEQGDRLVVARDRHDGPAPIEVTVIDRDRTGLLATIAGALALKGLTVLNAHLRELGSSASGETMVLDRLAVANPMGRDVDLSELERHLGDALDGRLAIEARLQERATYYSNDVDDEPWETVVTHDNHSSDVATILDISTRDSIGLLYRMARAMGELQLDIRSAHISTLGQDAADSFYVTDRSGRKIRDGIHLSEITRAIVSACKPST